MQKPPKTTRPKRPPIQKGPPAREIIGTIGLIQEKLIGRFVVEWAKLEACMGDAIIQLFGLEFEHGRIIIARMDANTLIRTLREIGQLRLSQEKYFELSKVCDLIDIAKDDRNLIVHGLWSRHPDSTPQVLSLRAKGGLPDQVIAETFSDTRMRSLIKDTRDRKNELIQMFGLFDNPTEESSEQHSAK